MPVTEEPVASPKIVKLPDVLRSLRRGAPIAIATAAFAAAFSVVVTLGMPPVYQASISLLAAQPPSSFGNLALVAPPQVNPAAFQSALLNGSVVRDALFKLEGVQPNEAALAAFKQKLRVSVQNQQVSSIVKIDVRDSNPQLAAGYANAIAGAIVAWDRDRARKLVESGISALEQSIADIDAQIADSPTTGDQAEAQRRQALLATLRDQRARELDSARARSASAVVVGLLQPFGPAAVPGSPIGPRIVFNTFLAVVLGVLLGYGVQFVRWSLRDDIGSSEKLAALTRLPVLAVFPKTKRLRDLLGSNAASFLRTNLMRLTRDESPVVVGLTSASSYSEKLGVGVALVEGLVASGRRTLFIDADLRRRGPGSGIDVSRTSTAGLEYYLRNPSTAVQPLAVEIGSRFSFGFIPTREATEQASELIEYGLKALLSEVKPNFDVIIIDLPPITSFADALAAAPACTAMVLCAGVNSSSKTVTEAAGLLRRVGNDTLGVVLTDVARPKADARQGNSSSPPDSNWSRSPGQTPSNVGRNNPQAVVRVKNR